MLFNFEFSTLTTKLFLFWLRACCDIIHITVPNTHVRSGYKLAEAVMIEFVCYQNIVIFMCPGFLIL